MLKDQIIAQKDQKIAELSSQNTLLKSEITELRRLIFGSKSERFVSTQTDEGQLNLFGTQDVAELKQSLAEKQSISYQRTKPHPGRNKLPDHFPLEEVIIEPDVDTSEMERMGEQITETLKYTPASLVRKRIIRPKYIDPKEEKIYIAPLPERALPKSIAESCLLSYIIVSKFVNHLPFYRQRQIFKRDYNWELPSSTINDWFVATCTLLKPLYDAMVRKVISSNYIQADESPLKVQDKDKKGKTHMGYQWVYSSPQDNITIFQYRKGRGMQGPKEILENYQGILQCDGYKVYDKVSRNKPIKLLGCLAHVRRKFFEAKDNDPDRSKYALELIKRIYEHERVIKDYHSDETKEYRIKNTKPIYDELKEWLENNRNEVLPKSKIGKAIMYAINQWTKLMTIFDNGSLIVDNNLIENKIRPLALGRKNYLFAGSHDGAQRIAMMYSFFATCKQIDVNPYVWLKDTLDRIHKCKLSELEKLIPR